MALESGHRLGPYEIVEPLGGGGMGEVYRARDTRLGRDVAIKVLSGELSQDVALRQRFEREARTISRLQHPHVCTIHDVGTHDGVDYLVMEYLEGVTLEERLEGGALPVDAVLEIGNEIAEAIEAAHRRGIVHRDLKPGNVMLTETGAKVLDFGLAREVSIPGDDTRTQAPTAAAITIQGTLLGTMPYMAPEQLEGRDADDRSDIWALGCILYEIATGERPFNGETQASLIGSILKDDPESPSHKQPLTPHQFDDLVLRCLEKDPERRWQSATDLGLELGKITQQGAPVSGSRSETDRPSIVVLPFTNMSSDPEQEYFCDGMAEEVINALTQLEGLHVVARTSAFSFKGRNVDVREIGNQLGVRSVLEGSVRTAGDRLRVTAQLVNVHDGYHLWSDRFDRQLDDVFAIQDEIAASIVGTSEGQVAGRRFGTEVDTNGRPGGV